MEWERDFEHCSFGRLVRLRWFMLMMLIEDFWTWCLIYYIYMIHTIYRWFNGIKWWVHGDSYSDWLYCFSFGCFHVDLMVVKLANAGIYNHNEDTFVIDVSWYFFLFFKQFLCMTTLVGLFSHAYPLVILHSYGTLSFWSGVSSMNNFPTTSSMNHCSTGQVPLALYHYGIP